MEEHGQRPAEAGRSASETIRFDDFLKLSGRVRSGGEAKHRIQAGEVLVGGTVETHRSRKLARGEKVTIDGETIDVAF